MKIEKIKITKIIFSKCIYTVIVMCMLYNLLFLINSTLLNKNYLKIFGISFFCINDDLMENDLYEQDLVIIREVTNNELKNDDIIAYNINGKVRINKILQMNKEYYITKSNKNYYPDFEKITYNQILGKKIFSFSKIGILVIIISSKMVTLIIFIVLIMKFLYNRYLYSIQVERIRKMRRNSIRK